MPLCRQRVAGDYNCAGRRRRSYLYHWHRHSCGSGQCMQRSNAHSLSMSTFATRLPAFTSCLYPHACFPGSRRDYGYAVLYPGSRNGDCGLVVWTGLCGWSRGLSVIGAQRCRAQRCSRRGVLVSMESESDSGSTKSTTISTPGSVNCDDFIK